MRNAYFAVEGPHDVEVVGRVLVSFHGAKRIQQLHELDQFWRRLIPSSYPPDGDLLKRVPVPAFFRLENVSVAIHSAIGDSQLARTLVRTLQNIDYEELSAIAIFCDADANTAAERYSSLMLQVKSEFSDINLTLEATAPGNVTPINDYLRFGIHVFPDNMKPGSLETLLMGCADISYPGLLTGARKYVDNVCSSYKTAWSSSGRPKAIVGCINNILRPGTANQVSIQHDQWICPATLATLSSLQRLNTFIMELLDLP